MNDIVSQLYIIRTELMEIQQKHFRKTLVQETVNCLLIGLEERFEEWGKDGGPQGIGCSEFAIAHFLDPHDKSLVLQEHTNAYKAIKNLVIMSVKECIGKELESAKSASSSSSGEEVVAVPKKMKHVEALRKKQYGPTYTIQKLIG